MTEGCFAASVTNAASWMCQRSWLTEVMKDPGGESSRRTDPTQQLFRSLNSVVRPLVKAGLGSPWSFGLGAVVREATGRVSGEPREVPLLGLRLGDKVVVSTSREKSQWLKNVEANDQTAVWFAAADTPRLLPCGVAR